MAIIVRAHLCLCQGSVTFDVTVSPSNGQFQINEHNSIVASGRVSILTAPIRSNSTSSISARVGEDGPLPLTSDDIYKELRLCGYDYGPTFRGVLSTDGTGMFSSTIDKG